MLSRGNTIAYCDTCVIRKYSSQLYSLEFIQSNFSEYSDFLTAIIGGFCFREGEQKTNRRSQL